ncbi:MULTISPECIES: mannitol dehydrogenase family protein [unclassified Pseudomonas]|jgi:tagaturonate reductase|uniref:mannitol dehydrogenase family protein n=1 Tax=unclassified Pseudomonas TaxID=196821 RepID=UPI002DBE3CD5|nr:mannitol dehydrogenase family protein [Pseudomonas sp. MS-1(2024)]MEC4168032.1 mannitol dehydrogenase family protein [Pseudomonas sp. MS-1(2024)]
MSDSQFPPILQFGTSRFLQAHVDLFVSQALERGAALGRIAVVQSTDSPASTARTAALASGTPYRVLIQGIENGQVVEQNLWASAISRAVHATEQWPVLRKGFVEQVKVVVSNTGDRGYQLDSRDTPALLDADAPAPVSFPAKLLVLLHDRWVNNPQSTLSLFPCELVARNGDVLRDLLVTLARSWALGDAFEAYLIHTCRWANSLVDRIVSQALEPVGAVAEPYALWAIERQEGLTLPCSHEAIVLTDDLDDFERLKLFTLNLGHSYLAERWLSDGRPATETVYQAMQSPALRADLEALWASEVLPVFAALGQFDAAQRYVDSVRERFGNPFLQHRLADIAVNHKDKKTRRLLPLVELAEQLAPGLEQPMLRAVLLSQH